GEARSTRRKTMPVSGGAGRSVSLTFCPVWSPTPEGEMTDLRLRCRKLLFCNPFARRESSRGADPAPVGLGRRRPGLQQLAVAPLALLRALLGLQPLGEGLAHAQPRAAAAETPG